jgi:molybdopterin converting factor small subunit
MKVTVLFHDELIEAVGKNKMEVGNVNSTDALIKLIADKYPAFGEKSYRVAVNKSVIETPQVLEHGDCIEFIPPVADT